MQTESYRPWMKWVLIAAASYNLCWGGWVVLFPDQLFELTGIATPLYPGIWQCVGMIVGVYGIGYGIAAFDPLRHWPIVLVGFLGKLFGPIGMLWNVLMIDPSTPGRLPGEWLWLSLSNDLIWIIPFAGILLAAMRNDSAPMEDSVPMTIAEANQAFLSQHGKTLSELNRDRPALLVFLRHSGCTFCREALADIEVRRDKIEQSANIVLVHMGAENAETHKYFTSYSLGDVDRISDPTRKLYRSYHLRRGAVRELLGPSVWWRGFWVAIVNRHGVGKLGGDGFQMPGAFVIFGDKIVKSFRHQTAAERPDYCELVR
ncbi:AhpC/TSA family protein [Novipirellula aureliae]|uniref:AhpC/TSA family protein n=1 Tax=Novipirellula aureliae TaxID=2527966 RepID=A0A5C6E953_9BACT|nr:SelL-related redox protein [Novipirellula aureliae]TWU45134.1 AhpC/TSA family protein [Novipirellula aureliae]